MPKVPLAMRRKVVGRLGVATAPEVLAAYVAAGAAIVATAANYYAVVSTGRRQRAADLIVAALGRFEGGSQRRSAGIAALRALSKGPQWHEYQDAVGVLFYSQLLYLFAHGSNRWESHEVANMTEMADWLLCEGSLKFEDQGDKDRLWSAMIRYITDYHNPLVPDDELHKHGGTPDTSAVKYLEEEIERWGPILKGPGKFSMPDDSAWIRKWS